MLYRLLKFPAKIALHFYCRKLTLNNKEILKSKGPLLVAANHPNSFLDAIILATLFKHPVCSLARGDAFANKFYNKLLHSLNMLPVYRISEGAENLEHNYTTFNECIDIFKKEGIVLIFSEGRCINEWHLRSLKKGTARLALDAWNQGVPLQIIPLGINYSSFRMFGKNMILNFGKIITQEDFKKDVLPGKLIIDFNLKLNDQFKKLVYEIEPGDREKVNRIFFIPQSLLKKIVLFIPSIIGWIINAPLYYPIQLLIRKRADDHYDSIVVGLLFILFPIYVIGLTLLAWILIKSLLAFSLLAIIPFTAWAHLQLRKQV